MSGNSSLAAGVDKAGLEPWRKLFRDRDIYDVISKAILVAAIDAPHEFRRRRDGIVELIYTALSIPILQGRAAGDEGSGSRALEVSDKGSKVASCTVAPPPTEKRSAEDNNNNEEGNVATLQQGNGNGGDNADAALGVNVIGMDWLHTLADEMDAETQEINEVLRIKEIVQNHHEQSADILFESLRRLQLMQLTADKIKNTDIGGAVAAVRKHKSHKIRMLVHEIIKDWKSVTDDWIAATKATMDSDSNKPMDISNTFTTEDEGGLATPPLDVGALYLVSQASAMQHVSEFLQGTDDDDRIMTNVTTSMDKGSVCVATSSRYEGLKPPSNSTVAPSLNKRKPPRNTNPVTYKRPHEQGSRIPLPRVRIKIKHSSTEYAPRELSKKNLDDKKLCEENQRKVTINPPIIAVGELPSGQVFKTGMQTQSSAGPKVKGKDQLAEMNLDETKRKLRGAYQEVENSKQKRAIQVVELSDVVKPRHSCSSPLTTSMNPVVCRTTPSTKSMDRINRTHMTNRSQAIGSCKHDRRKW